LMLSRAPANNRTLILSIATRSVLHRKIAEHSEH